MRILYLAYTGLLEPLGQSQVWAYLRLLSRQHQITIVTFEKAADLDDAPAMAAQRAQCEALDVRWIALRYHHRPRLLATSWDLLVFLCTALREIWSRHIDLMHCRGYIPSFVALIARRLTHRPFVFDMRALWPEEMVAAGRLKPGSLMFRGLKAAEALCLCGASAVVSLTDAGIAHLRGAYGDLLDGVTFIIIPTCVDLDLFRPAVASERQGARSLDVGSVGTILSGWFSLTMLATFFKAIDTSAPDTTFWIVTPEDHARVVAWAEDAGIAMDRLRIFGVRRQDVPQTIENLDAVAMFFTPGVAKSGSSPTRMAEILACGVPVVINPGVGDTEAIVRRHQVGVVVADASEPAMRAAVRELMELLNDPHLSARCIHAASDYFSLEMGVERYDRIYRSVGAPAPSGATVL